MPTFVDAVGLPVCKGVPVADQYENSSLFDSDA